MNFIKFSDVFDSEFTQLTSQENFIAKFFIGIHLYSTQAFHTFTCNYFRSSFELILT